MAPCGLCALPFLPLYRTRSSGGTGRCGWLTEGVASAPPLFLVVVDWRTYFRRKSERSNVNDCSQNHCMDLNSQQWTGRHSSQERWLPAPSPDLNRLALAAEGSAHAAPVSPKLHDGQHPTAGQCGGVSAGWRRSCPPAFFSAVRCLRPAAGTAWPARSRRATRLCPGRCSCGTAPSRVLARLPVEPTLPFLATGYPRGSPLSRCLPLRQSLTLTPPRR